MRLFGYDIIVRKHNDKFLEDVDEYIASIDIILSSLAVMKKQFSQINTIFKRMEWDPALIKYLNRDPEFFSTRLKHILEVNAKEVSLCVQCIVNLLLQCSASSAVLSTLPNNECTPPSLFVSSLNVLKSLKTTADKCSDQFQKFANNCSNLMGVYTEMSMHKSVFGAMLQEQETPDGIDEYYEAMLTTYFNEVTKYYDNLVIEINKLLISLGTYNNLFLSESINIKKDKQDFINLVMERNKEHKVPSNEDKLYTTTIYRTDSKELSKEEKDFLEYMKNKAKEGKK